LKDTFYYSGHSEPTISLTACLLDDDDDDDNDYDISGPNGITMAAFTTHTLIYYPTMPKSLNNITMATLLTTHIHKYCPISSKIP
jgi:hypothetical protein